ncbi:uncharacterized mitochondrial protein-like protein [Tanacetum coccineum]
MKKMYCLVVTVDYSKMRLDILKSFITGIENLVDHKVKVIRCDNGTEFKNREMNQFCEKKGILRQYSVARTPQQNGVAERRNRTLIKAARTMLADSKLPTTFWAEAVNTACYVQNRVLVVKPHNKTPYELFHGYSLNSKAFRVFNNRTRIVEENFHIRFSKSTPNVIGTKASDNACQARKETEPVKNYNLLPFDDEKKVDEDPRNDSESIDQEKNDNVNRTNNVNAASTNKVNVVDNEDVGAEADMNNLDTTIQVSPILTTRIHKDHPLNQVIGDLQSATQTRNMSKNLEEHGFVSTIQQRINHKDLQNCLFACFLSQEEPKRLKIEVYVCQPPGVVDPDFPDRVYKVEKALYGLHQVPKACTKLAQLDLDKGFVISSVGCSNLQSLWKKDTSFLGADQISSMGELTFFLGLQVQQKKDGIFISQDKYVGDILKKFGFTEVKTSSTPIETQKPLLKDEDGKDVDVQMYRSMIGSLMYLTSLRPDIMFVVCAYARYQVNPKVSHLHAVKRIFRYLKGQPKLGLWYPKDSPFDLVAYTDSDYVGASLDRKSTTLEVD